MHRAGGRGASHPPRQGLPVFVRVDSAGGGVGGWRDGGNDPCGGNKPACPREQRGGLTGEDLWVWEEKAEAGLGRGEDKRKRGRAAR